MTSSIGKQIWQSKYRHSGTGDVERSVGDTFWRVASAVAGVGTIINDDSATVSIGDATVTEGDALAVVGIGAL